MRVRVLIEYTEIPAVEELEALRQASLQLTSSPESVSVQLIENSKYPTIILEFQMKTQAQYKVVDKIDRTVKFYMTSPFYSDSSISFS